MRFLADENFPLSAVNTPRAGGHDVAAIKLEQPGAGDRLVLDRACQEGRVLLTFDKDFVALSIREPAPAGFGVVLFRFHPQLRKREAASVLLAVLSSRADWPGNLAIIDRDSVRLTPLPRSA